MTVACPRCQRPLPAEEINEAADLAGCPICGELYTLSELVAGAEQGPVTFVPLQAPPGCWCGEEFGAFEVGGSTRSWRALVVVPWVGAYSTITLGNMYGSQIEMRQFNLVLSLIGIPFLLGAILFATLALMSICGKVVVTIVGRECRIFTGVGPIGWTRRVNLETILHVEMTAHTWNHTYWALTLVGPTTNIRFGTWLSRKRQEYFLDALRPQLAWPASLRSRTAI
ncbi:hypothetical protein [Lignipirellula cremea]|uniref:Uncharacterized protein n=1 Tax=Lignipirellula cremea TaxID=2528010 RepID=A0A518E2Y9_9BACT|nr:hypothetical protein [Lignipirellula cremea]QDU98454.1 hypothetical protein Pla8534_63220 [Lignipirellula cremea]